MSALDNIPSNRNFLAPNNFKFQVKKLPNTNFFLQRVNIPSLLLPATVYANPFQDIPLPGDHIEVGELEIEFMIDEDMQNYMEVMNWITGIGFPDNYGQYKEISDKPITSGEGITSDISVLILTSSSNPKYEVVYKDAFPISLSSVTFDSRLNPQQYLTVSAVFKFRMFTVSAL